MVKENHHNDLNKMVRTAGVGYSCPVDRLDVAQIGILFNENRSALHFR